jgi:small-conductance mechanosensitive channel
MPLSLRLIVLFLLALPLLAPWSAVRAQDRPTGMSSEQVEAVESELETIRDVIGADGGADAALLGDLLGRIRPARETSQTCIDRNQSLLEAVEANLATLGEAGPAATLGVREQRRMLQQRQQRIERQLQRCRSLLLRANDLQDRITRVRQAQLAARLATREPAAWQIIGTNLSEPGRLWDTARLFLLRDSGISRLSHVEIIALIGLILFFSGGAMFLRQPMLRIAHGLPGGPTLTAGFVRAVFACSADILPPLLAAVVASIFLTIVDFGGDGWPLITLLSYGAALYFLFVYLVRLFLAPCAPAESYLPLPERTLRSIAQRLRILAVLLLLVALFSATLVVEGFPEPVQHFLRLVVATILIINLTRIIWLVGPLLRWHDTRVPRVLLVMVMLFALGAEWAGYLNLSEYIVGGVVGTLVSFGLVWFVWRLIIDLFDGLDEGRRRWQRKLRKALDVPPDANMPGLTWLRVLSTLLIWGGFLLLLLRIWGLSDTGFAYILRTLNEGVVVGQFEIVPIKLLWGVLALVLLIGVTGWFKHRLGERWLTRTRMERGARDAVVTISGYTGIAIAIVIGLSVAGVQFTNIALIAGALSVGIGFGLQNIFNNFVSGLILLFERPIKTDDWIVVGNTEGLVKRIRIRSTEIKTFDNADVIVPNSELIQAQVTNWMLRDPFGRVIVQVRVAYGSDPEQVRDLLERIGSEHPRVITDAVLAPPPVALFRRFGDYGMEFELRVFIRDIDYFLDVQSDLYFAIEREFRSHGIVIPYPRQDIGIDRSPSPWRPDEGELRQAPRRPGSEDSGHRGDADGT